MNFNKIIWYSKDNLINMTRKEEKIPMTNSKPTSEELLKAMNELLETLITNAEKLNELSLQVIAEEEVSNLQDVQERLFNQLLQTDETLQATYPDIKLVAPSKLQMEVNRKLDYFQELNQTFIENLKTTHGIIQFESEPPPPPKKHKP